MKEYKTELVWQTGGTPKDEAEVRKNALAMKAQLERTISRQAEDGWQLQFMTPYTKANTTYIVLTFEREKVGGATYSKTI